MRIPFGFGVLAFILAEIATFILVGKTVGILPTLVLILIGMFGGLLLLRLQGVATLINVRADLATGQLPARSLGEGAMRAFAALLIIVPGFLTDIAGLLLFIPAVRGALWRAFRRRISVRTVNVTTGGHSPTVELQPGEFRSAPGVRRPRLPEA